MWLVELCPDKSSLMTSEKTQQNEILHLIANQFSRLIKSPVTYIKRKIRKQNKKEKNKRHLRKEKQ